MAAYASMAGVLWSILINFHVHLWHYTGSDFKTLYASAWCLAHGVDGYRFANIATVFQAGGIAQPHSWFGHAPVYPPVTLALLAPMTLLPMWVAVYVWVLLSAALLAYAAASLARFAGEVYGLGRVWRLVLIVAVVAWPLVGFGLLVANVSVVVTSVCLLAVAMPEGGRAWPRALALALALILKPHMALWVLLALLLVPGARALGKLTCAYALGLAAALYGFAATRMGWGAGFAGYFSMLHQESVGGSMRAGSHELLEAAAQIVSLDSLLGYGGGRTLRWLSIMILLAMGWLLVRASLRLKGAAGRLRAVSAWSALGLIATYHRAADGMMLLVVLPWLASQLQRRWRDGWAWLVLGALTTLSVGLDFDTMRRILHPGTLQAFLLYRQGALAAAALAVLLVYAVTVSPQPSGRSSSAGS